MAQVNDKLISEVFDEIVKHKPSLSKFLIIDEEDEYDLDLRLLADQIIQNFPWPIGIELRRLFSGSMRDLNRGRLDQLFKTIERTMQFLSFVMVIELFEEVRDKRIKLEDSFIEQFNQRFVLLSLGNFAWIIRAIGNIFEKNEIDYFMPEMREMFNKDFYNGLDFWVPERNVIGHYQINLTDQEIEIRCVEYVAKLSKILARIAFIVKYRLVTIREIKVLKPRHKSALFEHWIDILNSSDSDFRSTEVVFDSFSDSNTVLLMKSIKQPKDFLNLSPLIIDTRTETIDTKEKFHLKKDIFMYTKFRGNKIFYIGTEVTEKCDLSILSNYQVLISDFNDLLKMIGTDKVPA